MGYTEEVTDETFAKSVMESKVPVLIDFWAQWCGPCRSLAPKLEEIAGEFQGKLRILKMNTETNHVIPSQIGVQGIPLMVLFKNGKKIGDLLGNQPKQDIVEFIQPHI